MAPQTVRIISDCIFSSSYMHVKGETRREQARTNMPSTTKAALERGKRAAPEHQSARTVPAVHPHDPPSYGNDYEVLASFPQMWQRSQGRNEGGGREGDGSWRRKTTASFQRKFSLLISPLLLKV